MPKQFQFGILYPKFLSLLANQIIMNVIHEGRNVKKFRELLGLNQQELSDKLGPGWSQKKVSLLEGKPEIDPPILYKAGLLKHSNLKSSDHSKGQYVNGGFHTNGIENFWSLLKRGIIGIFHQVSPQHLQRYCDEFAARYNTRKIKDNERFEYYIQRSEGRLTYNRLIGKELPPSIFLQMMEE